MVTTASGCRLSNTVASSTRPSPVDFAEVTTSGQRLEAPYSALLYDASGREWVFISPQPNVFTRTDIKVEVIEGDRMYYSQGPAAGTKVVTSGIAQLYGIEFGVGK